MAVLRSAFLMFSVAVSLWIGGGLRAYSQSLPGDVSDGLTQLDRAICLRQWERAIDITSGLMASTNVSAAYRQELLSFRQRLQAWRISPTPPTVEASCDRTLPMFLALAEPESPQSQPLDWNRALAKFRNPRPIVQLDHSFEPTDNLIPSELTANSPEVLTGIATPIDTTDGFSVVGGSVNRRPQAYSFLARIGDRVFLDADMTRAYSSGYPQIFIFDQSGQLLVQSSLVEPQASIQNFVIPTTDVYFAVVSPQGTMPVLDTEDTILDWQVSGNTSFDYTLTLTGVTPYQALLP